MIDPGVQRLGTSPTPWGFSLVELLLVVTIIGVAMAVAIPSFSPNDTHKLDLAAEEVAAALRFARSEAMRTGEPHGLRKNGASRFSVHQLNTAGAFPIFASVVLDPIHKKDYDVDVEQQPLSTGVKVTNTADPFDYPGLGKNSYVFFDGSGLPFYQDSSGYYLLDSGTIQLGYGVNDRTVSLARVTGRVTVQ